MSQADTKDTKESQGEKQPINSPYVTEISWFTIVVVTVAGVFGTLAFAQMIIESFFKE